MANTLKIVLILIGVLLIGYGLYIWVVPEAAAGFGSFQVEPEKGSSQIIAMIVFGILMLIGGIAYKRR